MLWALAKDAEDDDDMDELSFFVSCCSGPRLNWNMNIAMTKERE